MGKLRLTAFVAVVTAGLVSGCTYSGGELLYMLGFGKRAMVEAQFQLTDEPVLIFIDDDEGRVDWPIAKRQLEDHLIQALLRNKAAKKIIPPQTLQGIRQSDPEFGKRSCREIGEQVGATQVLWLRVADFFAHEEFQDSSTAAYFVLTAKVIDVNHREGARARLWPSSPEGHPVDASLPGDAILRLKTRNAICNELAAELAEKIAKLFYDYRPGDFEKIQ